MPKPLVIAMGVVTGARESKAVCNFGATGHTNRQSEGVLQLHLQQRWRHPQIDGRIHSTRHHLSTQPVKRRETPRGECNGRICCGINVRAKPQENNCHRSNQGRYRWLLSFQPSFRSNKLSKQPPGNHQGDGHALRVRGEQGSRHRKPPREKRNEKLAGRSAS